MDENQLLADQPLWEKLIKKGFWLYFFMIITAPVWYVIKVVVSNQLSVEDVGIFYSVMGFVLLISMYNDLWLTEALQYFLPKYWLEKKYDHYKTIIVFTLLLQVTLWVLIALAIYFWADWLALHHFKSPEAAQIIKTLSFYFVWVNIVQVFTSLYYAFQDVKRYWWIEFSRLYSTLWFTLLFWVIQWLTVYNFSLAWIIWVGVSIVVSFLLFGKKYREWFYKGELVFDKTIIKEQLKYAFWVFLSANVSVVLAQIDQQLIVNLLWPISAWYFAIYLTIISLYTVITTPILSLVFPIVSELMVKKENVKLQLLQNILYKYFSVFALSIGGIFFVLWSEIAVIFFGQKFLYSWELLKFSSPLLIINILFTINFWILAWTGNVKQRSKILLVGLLVTIVSILLLITWFGLWLPGAVLWTVLWWIVLWILSFLFISKSQKISFDWKFFFKNLVAILFLCWWIYFCKDFFFVLEDVYRYKNLFYLILLCFFYYWIIALVDYKNIQLLFKEIKSIKS